MTTKTRIFLATMVVALGLDQLTKQAIVAEFHYGERLPVIAGFFDLTHVRNPGGAFSMFAGAPADLRLFFFIGTTLIAIGLLIAFFRRLESDARLAAIALGSILGGAIGNLIDRLLQGEVIDFIDIHLWGGYTWPTFNLADSFIVVGVALLMLEIFVSQQEEAGEGDPRAISADAS